MTIETTLQVTLGEGSYTLLVKMIRIESVNYFFIRDKPGERELLSGKTLELTYMNSFSLTEFGGVVKSAGVPENIISAVQEAIMKSRQTWFIEKE